MISNIMPCCCCCCCGEYIPSNKNFYIQVKNKTKVFLNIILYYTLHGKRIIKPSPVFGPDKTQRIVFPSDASSLDFDVNDCSHTPPVLVCNKSISAGKSSCFNVINSQGYFRCIPTRC